jgi:hypothetical protein
MMETHFHLLKHLVKQTLMARRSRRHYWMEKLMLMRKRTDFQNWMDLLMPTYYLMVRSNYLLRMMDLLMRTEKGRLNLMRMVTVIQRRTWMD